MQRLLYFLKPLVRLNYRRPLTVLGVCIAFAVIGAVLALKLQIDTDIANLLPKSNPNVQALERLQEAVGGETALEVAVKSPDFEANIAFANRLISESLALYDSSRGQPFFSRAEFHRNTEVLKDHALYLATTEELNEIADWLEEEVDDARREANVFFFDLGFDDEEESDTDDELSDDERIEEFRQSYDNLIPAEYPLSGDSTVVMIEFFPNGSKSNIGYLEDMFEAYGGLVASLGPSTFHPDMEVRFGGRLQRHLSELESIMNDVFSSFALGFSGVILLVMIYFFFKKYVNYRRGSLEDQSHTLWSHLIRAPIPVIVIGVPLLISLCWTFGLVYLVLGSLNTMTSVLFVILFGLGIDYGIHYYARYIEIRGDGVSVEKALEETYERTGGAIFVSALTTAAALYILIVARFRGFSEFGFISGTGILLALFCMLFVLPSLLVLFENRGWILLNKRSTERLPLLSFRRFPAGRTIIVICLAISAFVLVHVNDLRFEYQFGELEPEFPEYEAFRAFSEGADASPRKNPAYIIADNYQDVFEVLDSLRTRMNSNPETMISDVEALQERFPPTDSLAQEKLVIISRIRSLLGSSFIAGREGENLEILRRAAETTEPLDEQRLPDFLKNRFMTRDGEVGRFVIIYPGEGLSDGRRSIRFKEEVGEVTLSDGRTYYAGSTSIVAAEMLDLMHDESPYMVIATSFIVFLFLYFSFRSFKWTMMAMLPLTVGFLFLFGIMLLFGLKFNFYNLVVLPAILGIGCDNGVHIVHRYLDEGTNSMWSVLSSTGQHISIGSLTTMIGFAGLLLTNHPGLRSIGVMAVTGIGMTLLTALVFLPAMIQFFDDRGWANR